MQLGMAIGLCREGVTRSRGQWEPGWKRETERSQEIARFESRHGAGPLKEWTSQIIWEWFDPEEVDRILWAVKAAY